MDAVLMFTNAGADSALYNLSDDQDRVSGPPTGSSIHAVLASPCKRPGAGCQTVWSNREGLAAGGQGPSRCSVSLTGFTGAASYIARGGQDPGRVPIVRCRAITTRAMRNKAIKERRSARELGGPSPLKRSQKTSMHAGPKKHGKKPLWLQEPRECGPQAQAWWRRLGTSAMPCSAARASAGGGSPADAGQHRRGRVADAAYRSEEMEGEAACPGN